MTPDERLRDEAMTARAEANAVSTQNVELRARAEKAEAKLAAVRALADEAREWGRGNPEVLFFEQDIRAVLDAEAEDGES